MENKKFLGAIVLFCVVIIMTIVATFVIDKKNKPQINEPIIKIEEKKEEDDRKLKNRHWVG